MTTPLQKAAQAVIDRWESPRWKDEAPTAVVIGALLKALIDEQAQSVEPVAVFNGLVDSGEHGAFNLDMLKMIPRGAHLYLHPPQADQEPRWMIEGSNQVWTGTYAELDAMAEAKRIGGTCKAYPVYTAPQQATDKQYLTVGDSQFESWYSELNQAGKGSKQIAREAYEAGLNEADAQQSKQVPMTVVMQQALNALQELWLLGDRAAAIANPAIEALKIAIQHPANKPLENSEIDALGFLGVEQFPVLFKQVPWGNELMPYVRRLARAIEQHHGIGGEA